MQNRLLAIGERHSFETDRAGHLVDLRWCRRLRHRRRLLDHAGELLERCPCRLKDVVELRKVLHRLEELAQIKDEGRQHTKREPAVGDEIPAEQEHGRGRQAAEERDPGTEGRGEPVRPDVGVAVATVDVLEYLLVARLAPERLHSANPSERLDVLNDDEDDRPPHRPIGPRRVVAKPPGQRQHERHRDQCHEAEARVEVEQDRRDCDHRKHRRDHGGEACREQLVERVHVRGEPRDDASRRVALIEGERQLLDVPEQESAQVEQRILSDVAGDAKEGVVGAGVHHQDGHQREPYLDQPAEVCTPAGMHSLVDADPHQVRDGQVCDRAEQDQRAGQQQAPAIGQGQPGEQPAAAPAQQAGHAGGVLIDLLGGHSPPAIRGGNDTHASSAWPSFAGSPPPTGWRLDA